VDEPKPPVMVPLLYDQHARHSNQPRRRKKILDRSEYQFRLEYDDVGISRWERAEVAAIARELASGTLCPSLGTWMTDYD
jgi:hypothetical protein